MQASYGGESLQVIYKPLIAEKAFLYGLTQAPEAGNEKIDAFFQ